MSIKSGINDFVVRFANVNGTGSSSANSFFAKSIFRMGIPVSSKNIFPSNIQGLPTWFEVRVSDQSYLGRKEGIDLLVAVNPQSMAKDVASVKSGGYFVYDNSKPLHEEFIRDDINYIGIPMMKMSMANFSNARVHQLLKNVIYLGALVRLLNIDLSVVKDLISEQFSAKPKLIPDNHLALDLGFNYIEENFPFPLPFSVEGRDLIKDKIINDGNTATALGFLYGGATVAAWYPITPSTSVAKEFESYAKKYRKDAESGKMNVAVIQAEDELAAIGMVLGAGWNGSRAFTATSGAGISLMNEFIGLGYFAEIPAAIVNVQRGGPSTGMPTRSQQSDILSTAYASHGDTKHPMLIPSTPTECFEMAALALDLAERLQTPVFVLSDLDLGMNEHLTEPLKWNDDKKYDRGKVYTTEDLDRVEKFGRYLDIDGDGIPYRTYPGTHPTKGSFFTRGTSHDEFAKYSEDSATYVRIMERLNLKWETAKTYVPSPEFYSEINVSKVGMIFFGSTAFAALEAMDRMKNENINVDVMRLRGFPFNSEVSKFIESHELIYVVEQNRDAQMRTLLIHELNINPAKIISVLHYDGVPITAGKIVTEIESHLSSFNNIKDN
jgi:2-oxoglutarate ferredoxin oxidoreductase subunit alpha